MTPPRYLVTGGSGFLGRHVVLALRGRGAEVDVLVRSRTAAASGAAVSALIASGARLLIGDLEDAASLTVVDPSRYAHVIHVAAIYDLAATRDALIRANVDATMNLLTRLKSGFIGTLHHISSVAVAGDFSGTFEERHFDEGQRHTHPYHETKFAAERLVRASGLDHRVYRPSAIVGHARTGVADRIDGPYFYFKPIQRTARALPAWFPLFARTQTPFNMVPVDFVADAIVALSGAHHPSGSVFHLVDPDPPKFWEMLNLFLAAANGPRLRNSKLVRSGLTAGSALGSLGGVRFYRQEMMRDLGVPPEALDAMNDRVRYGAAPTTAALAAVGVQCPRLETYAEPIWDYWARTLDPDRDPARKARSAFSGRRVLVTGASSGIGAEVARQLAALGAKLVLVARRVDKLEGLAAACRAAGAPEVTVAAADLSAPEQIDALAARVLAEVGTVDILINNAGHSIRRPLAESRDRMHDFERLMQLNYFGAVRLTLALLPAMRAQRYGHVVNVLSAGTTIVPPRFGQYQASKAALNAFSDALCAEHLHEGIFTTSVYMPLVKTPMVDATDAYQDQPGMLEVAAAARLVLDGVTGRRRRVMDTETARRSVWMIVAPSFMTRVLNVMYRMHPEEPGAHPELEPDRAMLARFLGSYRI